MVEWLPEIGPDWTARKPWGLSAAASFSQVQPAPTTAYRSSALMSIASSRAALKLRAGYAEAFNNICAAENALGRYADAIPACERALALKPDFPLARNNLAFARSKRP